MKMEAAFRRLDNAGDVARNIGIHNTHLHGLESNEMTEKITFPSLPQIGCEAVGTMYPRSAVCFYALTISGARMV